MSLTQRLDQVIDDALETRIVGGVIIVAHDGNIVYRRAAGFFNRETGLPMREDAIFRYASLSKPLVAATALAMIDNGLLDLDQPVTDSLPWFRPALPDGSQPIITVRHLITHTAGLVYGGEAFRAAGITGGLQPSDLSLEENTRRLVQLPLLFAPGTAWSYSMGIDVLGAVIAEVNGTSLAEAVAHFLTRPLGLADIGFSANDPARLGAVYADNAGDVPLLMREPHLVPTPDGDPILFSPGRILRPEAFNSGGAGMGGSAGDFLQFLEAMRQGGGPVLQPETVAAAFSNQIGDIEREDVGQKFGFLGAVVTDPVAAGLPHAMGTVNWGGVYGHSWFIDPANKLSVVSLTNTAVEGCMGLFPDQIRDAVYG